MFATESHAAARAIVLVSGLAVATTLSGCGARSDAIARGKDVFDARCSVCHEDRSDTAKVGPGLKNLYRKPPHPLSNGETHSHTEAEIRRLVTEGTRDMPPMKEFLSQQEIEDVLAYLQTL